MMTHQEQAIISLNDRLTQLELKASIELEAIKQRLLNLEQMQRTIVNAMERISDVFSQQP